MRPKSIHDGVADKVAVKVIRPGVRRRFFQDLESYFLAARLQEKYIPSSRRLRPVEVTETLAQTTKIEMDLRLEAAALSELGENTKDDPGFRVPSVDWERTGRDVLTMEWVDGIKMNDIAGACGSPATTSSRSPPISSSRSCATRCATASSMPTCIRATCSSMPTAPSLPSTSASRDGSDARSDAFLPRSSTASSPATTTASPRCTSRPAMCRRQHDVSAFAQAIRAIGEPIHGQPAETISMARLLTLLFEVTELFDMETRTELVLLQKTMVVVEGVARTLDPAFNMWRTSEPVVGDWIAANLGPRGALSEARQGLSALVSLGRQLPDLAARAERLSHALDVAAQQGLRLDPETAKAIGREEARRNRSGRVALWVIALTLVYLAWHLV